MKRELRNLADGMLSLRKITICWKIWIQLKLKNNHTENIWTTVWQAVSNTRHNFNAYGKFNIIEQVNNLFASTLPVVKAKNINRNTTKMRKAMETIYIYLLTDKTNEPRVLQVISSFHLTEQITFVPEIVRPLPEWLVLVEHECIIWFLGTSVINFPWKLGACHLRLTMHLNLINLWL